MIGIVVSRADSASVHIGEHLLDLGDFERTGDVRKPQSDSRNPSEVQSASEDGVYRADGFELREFDDLHLHLDGVADAFDDPEFLVFVSRHAGETGPLLTAHFTGNFGAAEYGGADRSLAPACPNAHRRVVAALDAHAPAGYDVGMECTHHGPTDVGAPSMFVELGSGENEWRDPDGARAVAAAVLDLRGAAPLTDRSLVAFGGGHYVPRPERIVRETEWAVGHVAADWCLDDLGDPREHADVVAQMFEASGATRAVVDGDRPAVESVVTDLGYRVVSETWVRETSRVPLALAGSLEADLRPVDDGLRFGDSAATHDGDYVLVDLPPELLDAAHAADAGATVDAGRSTALAVATEENGNRLTGAAAFPDEDAYAAFLERVAEVLGIDYDDVAVDGETLTATREAFDPESASELGVPEGPAFGRLASGEAVTVDDREIQPSDVSRTETLSVSVGFGYRARERVRRPSDAEGKGN